MEWSDREITRASYRLGHVDVSFLDVSDSYVILTLTICDLVGLHFEFLIEDEMGSWITIDGS